MGRIIILSALLLFNYAAKCNTDSLANLVFSNLKNIYNKPQKIKDSGAAIYIIVTERSCNKCFEDVCSLYKNKEVPVYIIIFMKKDMLAMLSKYNSFSAIASCIKDTYFFWTDKFSNADIDKIVRQPSPQLLIKGRAQTAYKSYADFLEMIKE